MRQNNFRIFKEHRNKRRKDACDVKPLMNLLIEDACIASRTGEFPFGPIELVEPVGIEPTTPCLQSRCSPS